MKCSLFSAFLAWPLLVFACARASVTEAGAGILNGPNYAYALHAPPGWMFDTDSGKSQGLDAVFYPKGGQWEHGDTVIYASSRPVTEKIKTAADVARAEIDELRQNGSPKYTGVREKTIKTTHGHPVEIYYFSGDRWGNREAIAYFVEERTINFIVLSARSQKLFQSVIKAFESIAQSYSMLSDEVNQAPAPTPAAGESPRSAEKAK